MKERDKDTEGKKEEGRGWRKGRRGGTGRTRERRVFVGCVRGGVEKEVGGDVPEEEDEWGTGVSRKTVEGKEDSRIEKIINV